MIRVPPRSTRTDTLFPYTTLFRSVTIVAILALIAYPSYINSITRSKRAAATACLSSYATFMERFYTTNLRYDVDTAGDDVALPTLDCATAANTGADYGYQLDEDALGASTYRSEERRVGKECVSTCRSRWSPYH